MDFLDIEVKRIEGELCIIPSFKLCQSKDIMIRGRDFYALYLPERGYWTTNPFEAIEAIDKKLYELVQRNPSISTFKVLYLKDANNGSIDRWHKFCQRQMYSIWDPLDMKVSYEGETYSRGDFRSKCLPYKIKNGSTRNYDGLFSVLYDEKELDKLEWLVGGVLAGDNAKIQKMAIIYGAPGMGKSTYLYVIEKIFEGYWSAIDTQALVKSNDAHVMEMFKDNPLVGLDHESKLNKIEDNSRLNNVASHETLKVNEKYKTQYDLKIHTILFAATNNLVQITDSKSGIIRRLIDVKPSNVLLPIKTYEKYMNGIFEKEIPHIAYKCLNKYLENKKKYAKYEPTSMFYATNDVANFFMNMYDEYTNASYVLLSDVYTEYQNYCEYANVRIKMSMKEFTEETKSYFFEFYPRYTVNDRIRKNVFKGFRINEDGTFIKKISVEEPSNTTWTNDISYLDSYLKDCLAQEAGPKGTPSTSWDNCKTYLKDINPYNLHYVRPPTNIVMVDFDLRDENNNKDFQKNYDATLSWYETYAEVSKSGGGIHLIYTTTQDLNLIDPYPEPGIEVKVYKPDSKASMRRIMIKNNNHEIVEFNNFKEKEKKMISSIIEDEIHLRNLIAKGLNREIHPNTAPSVSYICHMIDEAHNNDVKYDISDLKESITTFAQQSRNQMNECLRKVSNIKWSTAEDIFENLPVNAVDNKYEFLDLSDKYIYDVEIFPNLFVLCYKKYGKENPVISLINPSPEQVKEVFKNKMMGFYNRGYDNHICYKASQGYTNRSLYELSKNLIDDDTNKYTFPIAYSMSYADIYDFSVEKRSLKSWQIKLKLNHVENDIPWDENVPEDAISTVVDYCNNDVITTEEVFDHLKSDYISHCILAILAGGKPNDTKNSLTERYIFQGNSHPRLNYRFMGCEDDGSGYEKFDDEGKPIFPGYTFDPYAKKGEKSVYRGLFVSEGGLVVATPGYYEKVFCLDADSMHPTSIIEENYLGAATARFKGLKDARMAIKGNNIDSLKDFAGGLLTEILSIPGISLADVSSSFKLAINSGYGLTFARFSNPFKDKRNIDNMIAKRGALFMVNLYYYCLEKGLNIFHIKTDSIKISFKDVEDKEIYNIIEDINNYAHTYGYNFKLEAVYDRICLVNDTVYIASEDTDWKKDSENKVYNLSNKLLWTATGLQFAVPYIIKSLFTNEPITFDDLCVEKSVRTKMFIRRGEHLEFVGRTGLFVPVNNDKGGELVVERYKTSGNTYDAVSGSKGYLWAVASDNLTVEDVDLEYWNTEKEKAIEALEKFVSYDEFTSPF